VLHKTCIAPLCVSGNYVNATDVWYHKYTVDGATAYCIAETLIFKFTPGKFRRNY